jgi:ketosteroid isomerase-like protein
MAERAVLLDKVRMYFDTPGGDVEHAAELYHDDAVLEFPQSGERFDGRATFTEWRSRYPAKVRFQLRRVTVRNDLVVVELSASYEGGPTMLGVGLLEFRGDKIAHERVYVMDGWDAPDWRSAWRSPTPADPPE